MNLYQEPGVYIIYNIIKSFRQVNLDIESFNSIGSPYIHMPVGPSVCLPILAKNRHNSVISAPKSSRFCMKVDLDNFLSIMMMSGD